MPTIQQQAARLTREAWDGLLRTAAFVPEEKRDWVPQGKARTMHDFVAECAVMADWGATFFQKMEFPPFDPEAYSRAKAELDTLDKIKSAGETAITRLCEAIESVPTARLEESHEMPWGMSMTVADLLFMGYWNIVYHTGQVNYVQMLLGDTEMH
jgi:uncharacterized damage-inducible protein DinB